MRFRDLNVKKVLALVLAFACAFTMFAGAAFTDQADISDVNAEAVDLLTTLNIIKGYEDGSFQPDVTVTRAEMAKMIYTIRNGGNDDASAYETITTSFTDIAGHWAEGYIKYLQNTGIVAGKSDYIFDPDSTVTTGEAMKMALVLGGYRSDKANLTGTNWLKNTVTLATTNGLTDDVTSAVAGGCTRQDAAQILANALGMTAVQWSEVTGSFLNDSEQGLAWGGDPISVGRKWMDLWTNIGTLVRVESDEIGLVYTKADISDSDDPSIDTFIKISTDYSDLLGQKVKVLFDSDKNNAVIGVFAVPGNSTTLVNRKEIGTDGEKVSFGGNSYALENGGADVYVDGKKLDDTKRANYFKSEQSADLVTFVDIDDNGKFDAACIKTVTVAKVTYASASQIIAGGITYKFADDNIDENVAKDDWVQITKNYFNDNNDIAVVEPITGTVEAVKTGTYYQYQIGDEWYNEGPSARSNNNIKSNVKAGVEVEAVVVNGIVFAAEKTSGEAGKLNDILFVTYIEKNGLNAKTASVMYPDGKQETIKLDSYNTDDTGATIQVGAYYEYSKSGSVYKLSTVAKNVVDAYGDFTNIDNPTDALASLGSTGAAVVPEAGTYNAQTIADTADVIVYQPVKDSSGNLTGYNVKHITGKQLKNSFESGTTTPKINVDANGLGAFTSKVNGLTRVSSLAVLYTGAAFDTDMDAITGSSFYGYVTKDAVKKVVGGVDGIEFYIWTGSENVKVFANTTKDSDYVAGTIVGYNAITEDSDGNKLIDGLTDLTATAVGSISEVGVNGDANTIRLSTGAEIDLDAVFDTVLYMNTTVKDENGAQSGVVDGTPTEANAQQSVRPTNFIRVGNDVAVIDSNAFVSGPYATTLGYSLPTAVNGAAVQWVDNRTQDNTPNNVYPGALVDLTFKVNAAGSLQINNVKRNDNGTANPTYTFTSGQVNTDVVIEGLLVTGNVTFTWTGATAGGADAESAKALNDLMQTEKDNGQSTYTYEGVLPTDGIIQVPAGMKMILKNATMNGANIAGDVEVDGSLTMAGTNGISGKLTLDSTADTINAFPGAKLAAGSIEDTATTTTAAKVTELLDYSKNVTVKEISSCADIDIASGETVTANKVTLTDVPTSIVGTLTADEVDASAVATPSAANVATLFGYADDVTVGTVTDSSAAVAVGAAQILRAADLNLTGTATATVDATGALYVDAASITSYGAGIKVTNGGKVYVNAATTETELMTDIYAGDITIKAADEVALDGNVTILKDVTLDTGKFTQNTHNVTVAANVTLALNGATVDASKVSGTDNTSKLDVQNTSNITGSVFYTHASDAAQATAGAAAVHEYTWTSGVTAASGSSVWCYVGA